MLRVCAGLGVVSALDFGHSDGSVVVSHCCFDLHFRNAASLVLLTLGCVPAHTEFSRSRDFQLQLWFLLLFFFFSVNTHASLWQGEPESSQTLNEENHLSLPALSL